MTTSDENKDRATTEAARWLIALEDDPDDGDLRARFNIWLAASPANAAAWAHTSDIYNMMATTQPAYAEHWAGCVDDGGAAASRTALAPARIVSVGSVRRRLGFGLAVAALAACLAFIIGPGVALRMQADYVTSTAELHSVQLEDGSTVRLGADSAIDIAFVPGERNVRLLKGEAFFEVTPDSARPFRVVAGQVETTVIGTMFDVRLAEDAAIVAVRHGTVRVDDRSVVPPVMDRLGAGDWVRVSRSGRVDRGSIPPDEVASWLNGQIIARDQPMADIVDELRRHFTGLIVITDGELGHQRITGVYNLSDPVAALRAVVGAHGGSVRQISPWLLVASGD